MLLRASPVLENGHGPYEQLPKSHGTNMEYDGLHSTPDLERLQKSSLKNILVKLLEQQKKSVIRLKARLFFLTHTTHLSTIELHIHLRVYRNVVLNIFPSIKF
jgi:hypothetical protein